MVLALDSSRLLDLPVVYEFVENGFRDSKHLVFSFAACGFGGRNVENTRHISEMLRRSHVSDVQYLRNLLDC